MILDPFLQESFSNGIVMFDKLLKYPIESIEELIVMRNTVLHLFSLIQGFVSSISFFFGLAFRFLGVVF